MKYSRLKISFFICASVLVIISIAYAIIYLLPKNATTVQDKNCIIVYYSLTGNTERLAYSLSDILKKDYSVKVENVDSLTSKGVFDLSSYDLIAFGSGVYFREFSPEMREYIKNVSGLETKEVILFETYGSGFGRYNALRNQEVILMKKGVKNIKKIMYPGTHTKDSESLNNALRFSLDDEKNNIIASIPEFLPLMDYYSGPKVKITICVDYLDSDIIKRVGGLGVWTKKTFDRGLIPDIDIGEMARYAINEDFKNIEVLVPKEIGDIYLGIFDQNGWTMHPDYILNNINELPLKIKEKNIKNFKLNAIYKKVFICGAVKNEGAYIWNDDVKVLDLVEKAGGFSGNPENLKISVVRIKSAFEDEMVVGGLLASDPLANASLEVGDHVDIDKK